MSNINQLITITLLNAISSTKQNVNYNNNEVFRNILSNTFGSTLVTSGISNKCDKCISNSATNGLETLMSIVNTDRINNNNSIISESKQDGKMDRAMDLLQKQLGKKYVWGATGPDSFDCSGLVQYIYKTELGKNIPRTSYEQSKYGEAVNREDLQVGDLVFFDTMNKGKVSHVGMYIGNNEFIHASNKKDGVKKSSLDGYYDKKYIVARRP